MFVQLSDVGKSIADAFLVHSFGLIWMRISDPRSPGSWCINRADESLLVTDSPLPLMNYDPSDLGSLILIEISPKERAQKRICEKHSTVHFKTLGMVCCLHVKLALGSNLRATDEQALPLTFSFQ